MQNPIVTWKMNQSAMNAKILFPDAEMEIKDDPLQMGSLFISIKVNDIVVRETNRFCAVIKDADNFEIYQNGNDIIFTLGFNDALREMRRA